MEKRKKCVLPMGSVNWYKLSGRKSDNMYRILHTFWLSNSTSKKWDTTQKFKNKELVKLWYRFRISVEHYIAIYPHTPNSISSFIYRLKYKMLPLIIYGSENMEDSPPQITIYYVIEEISVFLKAIYFLWNSTYI